MVAELQHLDQVILVDAAETLGSSADPETKFFREMFLCKEMLENSARYKQCL